MGSDTDIISYIREHKTDFSKRQRIIADYIMQNYDSAAYMTAAALAAAVGVSESTVVRFAAELGFDGYQKLQKRLQEVTPDTVDLNTAYGYCIPADARRSHFDRSFKIGCRKD